MYILPLISCIVLTKVYSHLNEFHFIPTLSSNEIEERLVGFYSDTGLLSHNYTSTNVSLTPNPPVVDPVQTFCGSPLVSDLIIISGTGATEWYESETGGLKLDDTTPLVHDKKYYAQSRDSAGNTSLSRAETKVVISNPTISASQKEVCSGEKTTLTVSGIPKTPKDFINAHPELRQIQQYNDAYYFVKEESMSWEAADALGKSLEGTSMYIINDSAEEQAVYNGLKALGLTGFDEISFWFGLKQTSNSTGVGSNWFWVDGSPLTYQNWAPDEPNDCCVSENFENNEENYGQFEFRDNGIQWNDIPNSSSIGDSWPLFEFTGTTNVVWGYFDNTTSPPVKVPIPGIDTSSFDVNPTETTTYYIEVTTNTVLCESTFEVIVKSPPTSSPASDIVKCEDNVDGLGNDGIIQGFLMNQRDNEILGALSPSGYFVTYHETQQNAIDNLDPIDPNTGYENKSNPQTIYVRLEDKATGCFVTDRNFELKVNELPIINPVDAISECDDDNDGIFNNFILETRESQILGSLSPADYTVTYHETLSDANDITKTGLSSPYQNTLKDEQIIYYRVQNNTSECFTTDSLKLIVSPLPVLKNGGSITVKQCNDPSSSSTALTNLTIYEEALSVNAANETFKYFESATFDASSEITDPTRYENINSPVDVHVKIKTANNCERDALIKLENSVSSITAGLNKIKEVCEDSSADTPDGISIFPKEYFEDLRQIIIDDFNKNGITLSNPTTTFYENKDDALTKSNPIDETKNYTNSTPWNQEIWVNIENEDSGIFECYGLKQIATFKVRELPSFEVDGDQIVCLNLSAIPIKAFNPAQSYTYSWTRTDSSSNTVALPDVTSKIYVSQGGVYTVTAKDNLGCQRSLEILVKESIIASIELDDIGINDLTNNGTNTILISTTDLGIGDYEYALDNQLGPYQDEPMFENVKPGPHTIYVRDKNNCGIDSIDISVIGYPKYFTPNADGYNDYWNIIGVSNQFLPNSTIYIFDRFGKLLKEINPLETGWDGKYLDNPVPASDYWFRVYLEDGREFKGHFTLKR